MTKFKNLCKDCKHYRKNLLYTSVSPTDSLDRPDLCAHPDATIEFTKNTDDPVNGPTTVLTYRSCRNARERFGFYTCSRFEKK